VFFLLRTAVIIAVIYTYSPVRDLAEGLDEDMTASNTQLATDALASLIDETQYENWTALPQYARDRLTMEIARQLADAAGMR